MTDPIVVTGAAGKTGQVVTGALKERGAMVRGVVRREEQRPISRAAGAAEVALADLADSGALERAFAGAAAIYYICPNMTEDEPAWVRAAFDAARRAGVERFVYHSVLHPQIEAMPHHWKKMRAEEALFESGLAWTVLQPTAYMENILGQWKNIAQNGVFGVPYPVTSRISLVALRDVGEAAARVCTEPGHDAAVYELVGTAPLSQREVAHVLSETLGRAVRPVERPIDEVRADLEAAGISGYPLQGLLSMFDYYARHGLEGAPRILGWLLGRAPRSLAEFVQDWRARADQDERV